MVHKLRDKVILITGVGSSGPGWGNGKAIAALARAKALTSSVAPGRVLVGRINVTTARFHRDQRQATDYVPGRSHDAHRSPSGAGCCIEAQRGSALLLAMLTVALVATLATTAAWQQWRGVEIEQAERTRVQSAWIQTGVLDWTRLILREDARAGLIDHLGEPWAVPLQDARLSTFLAADRSNSADTEAEKIFLQGQIVDLQSLLNVSNIARTGGIHEPSLQAFGRLFDLLGLQQADLTRMAENLRVASDIGTHNRSASSRAPLVPQKVEQLVWLGLSVNTVTVLQPYVTVLPESGTTVNLNTANAEVIYAAVPGISMSDAQRLVAERARTPLMTVDEAAQFVDKHEGLLNTERAQVGFSSRFFEVHSRLRLDDLIVEERSVVMRDGLEVHTLRRERGRAGLPTQAAVTVRP